MQQIMSRTGSFPLRVAYELLQKHSKTEDLVLDPFCGKGTSLLAARMLRHSAFGIDIAPEAVVCSSAKLANVTQTEILQYVSALPVDSPNKLTIPRSVRAFFHPATLYQLISIRDVLLQDMQSTCASVKEMSTVVLATLLGILHGHASYSLSISSAHAYSMSANYVSKYAAKHGLKRPRQDVRECLTRKLSRCLTPELPAPVKCEVRLGSALNCSEIYPKLIGKVDLILTSPPYLNAQTYAKDNWLRLWVLGFDYRELHHDYIETGSETRYISYMNDVVIELFRMLKPNGVLICIAGDVRRLVRKNGTKQERVFKTGVSLAELCQQVGFDIEQQVRHIVPNSSRYLHALSKSNGHSKRNCVERVFIARKP